MEEITFVQKISVAITFFIVFVIASMFRFDKGKK
jgi:hypothetical protein